MRRALPWVVRLVIGLVVLALVLTGVVSWLTYHPDPVEAAELTCSADAPDLHAGQDVTVMSWNVRYLAGRGYVFYYDLPDRGRGHLVAANIAPTRSLITGCSTSLSSR